MCGIFGITINETYRGRSKDLKLVIKNLFLLSESRGKEASGVSILSGDSIYVYKDAKPASSLIKDSKYNNLVSDILGENTSTRNYPLSFIGHTRLVTDGSQYSHDDNQPIITDGISGIHNGIIVNKDRLCEQFPKMERNYEVDSEIIFSLIHMFRDDGYTLSQATQETFQLLEGMASVAVFFKDLDYLLLATNNGSLYQFTDKAKTMHIFSSEQYILEQLIAKQTRLKRLFKKGKITQVCAGEAHFLNLRHLSVEKVFLDPNKPKADFSIQTTPNNRKLIDIVAKGDIKSCETNSTETIAKAKLKSSATLVTYDISLYDKLKRCHKCLLPETMPFITFDDKGICSFCNNYPSIEPPGPDVLEKIANSYRSKNGDPDCIVGLSGGRDSTYALHYIKTVLEMNPIAYTYDWGMVTDLARRNISRICGKLGIEHILISANITRNRQYIRKNVLAWLKKPHLGLIPLFMAGDKRFLYLAQQLKKRFRVKLDLRGENMLERTHFKTGFAGVKPDTSDKEHVYTMPFLSKMQFALFYAKRYLQNPAYMNASLLETIYSFAFYYVLKLDYVNIYHFLRWDEEEIIATLIDEYNWECATDTKSTWRIGDGTASFYNYIYYSVAGFSEMDCFRSNQIREGTISREKALQLVKEENKPRYESIKWYCDIIGIDFKETISRINQIPKLYKQ